MLTNRHRTRLIVLFVLCGVMALGATALNAQSFTPDFTKQAIAFGYAPAPVYNAGTMNEENTLAIRVADLDNNGHKDLVYLNGHQQVRRYIAGGIPIEVYYAGQDYIAFNAGGGDFSRHIPLGSKERVSSDVELADFNGDQHIDILVGYETDPRCVLYLNDGSGGFAQSQSFGNAQVMSLGVGELDGESGVDLVTSGPDGTFIWLNDGSGNFSQGMQIPVDSAASQYGGWPDAVAIGDVNNDGKNDVAIACIDGLIFFNTGSATFNNIDKATFHASNNRKWLTVAIADFTKDGKHDVLMAGSQSSTAAYRIKTWSAGALVNVSSDTSSNNGRYAAHADLDGDGDIDLLAVGAVVSGVNGQHIYFNDGTGAFPTKTFLANSGNEKSTCGGIASVNADTRPDLILGLVHATNGGAQNRILLNTETTPNTTSTLVQTSDPTVIAADGSETAVWSFRVRDLSSGDGLPTTVSHVAIRADVIGAFDFAFDAVTQDPDTGDWMAFHLVGSPELPALNSSTRALMHSLIPDPFYKPFQEGVISGFQSYDQGTGLLVTGLAYNWNDPYGGTGRIAILGNPDDTTLERDYLYTSLDDFEWSLSEGANTISPLVYAGDGYLQFLTNATAQDNLTLPGKMFTLKARVKPGVKDPASLDHCRLQFSAVLKTSGSQLATSSLVKTSPVQIEVSASSMRVLSIPPAISTAVPFPMAIQYTDAQGNRDVDYREGQTVNVFVGATGVGTLTVHHGMASGNVTVNIAAPTSVTLRADDGAGMSVESSLLSVVPPGVPTIASMSSDKGIAQGGDSITVSGIGFSNATVAIDNVPVSQLTISNDFSMSFVTPATLRTAIDGSVTVDLVITGNASTLTVPFTYYPCIIDRVDPVTATSGQTPRPDLTVYGRGFAGANYVRIGGATAVQGQNVHVAADGKSLSIMQPIAATSDIGRYVDVKVRNAYGTAILPRGFGWDPRGAAAGAKAAARIVGPNGDHRISLAGGETFTLKGSGLLEVGTTAELSKRESNLNADAKFDSLAESTALDLLSATGSEMTLRVPWLEQSGLYWPEVRFSSYSYGSLGSMGHAPALMALTPNRGDVRGNDIVLIAHFQNASTLGVTFGNQTARLMTTRSVGLEGGATLYLSTVLTPAMASEGQVSVHLSANGVIDTLANAFTFETRSELPVSHTPMLSSVLPSNIIYGITGEKATLSGNNLLRVNSVSFGNQLATILNTWPNRIEVEIPASDTPQTVTITVRDEQGRSTNLAGFEYTTPPVPTITSVTPNRVPSTAGNQIAILGNNLDYVTDAATIQIGGVVATRIINAQSTAVTVEVGALPTGQLNVSLRDSYGRDATLAAALTCYPENVPLIWQVKQFANGTSGPARVAAADPTVLSILGDFLEILDTVRVVDATGSVVHTLVEGQPDEASDGFITGGNINPKTEIRIRCPELDAGNYDLRVSGAGHDFTITGAIVCYPANVPIVWSISPASSSSLGGVEVTATGDFLDNVDTVTIGGQATRFIQNDASFMRFETLPMTPGTGLDVRFAVGSGVSAVLAGAFDVEDVSDTPTLDAVYPTVISPRGGEHLMLSGSFLEKITAVKIGGQPTVLVGIISTDANDWPALTIQTLPNLTPGVGLSIEATGNGHSVTLDQALTVYAADLPYAVEIFPVESSSLGGVECTVYGDYLDHIETVTIGGQVTELLNASTNTVVFKTLALTPGSALDVVLSGAGKQATLPGVFSVYDAETVLPLITSVAPTIGSLEGGDSVVIQGEYLDAVDAVFFGDTEATIVSQSRYALIVTAPPATQAQSVAITLRSGANGAVAASVDDAWFYSDMPQFHAWDDPHALIVTDGNKPLLFLAEPASSALAGGEQIVVFGERMDEVLSIAFGTVSTSTFTLLSPTQISITVPPATASGEAMLTVTSSAGKSNFLPFTYESHQVTKVSPNRAAMAGGTRVRIIGSGFVPGSTTVRFGELDANILSLSSKEILVESPESLLAETVNVYVSVASELRGLSGGFRFVGPDELLISELSPASGNEFGGEIITMSGQQLHTVNKIELIEVIQGTQNIKTVLSFLSQSASSISFVLPWRGVPGVADVKVRTTDNTSDTLERAFTFTDNTEPYIQRFTPYGSPLGGDLFEVFGEYLGEVDSITIGTASEVPATAFLVRSFGHLTLTLPANPNMQLERVDVIFTMRDGSEIIEDNGFDYRGVSGVPLVLSVENASGPLRGGTTVTLSGSGLNKVTRVLFGNDAGTILLPQAANLLYVQSPRSTQAPGTVDLTLEYPDGIVTVRDAFTYLAPAVTITNMTPRRGSVQGGTRVMIQGTGLLDVAWIELDSIPITPDAGATDVALLIVMPAHPAGAVSLQAWDGLALIDVGSFTYDAPIDQLPQISGLSRSRGRLAGGETITINGQNLGGVTQVIFGTIEVPPQDILARTQSSITIVTPPGLAAGTIDVTVSDGTNSDTLYDAFTYVGRSSDPGVIPEESLLALVGCSLSEQSDTTPVLGLLLLVALVVGVRRKRRNIQ